MVKEQLRLRSCRLLHWIWLQEAALCASVVSVVFLRRTIAFWWTKMKKLSVIIRLNAVVAWLNRTGICIKAHVLTQTLIEYICYVVDCLVKLMDIVGNRQSVYLNACTILNFRFLTSTVPTFFARNRPTEFIG